MTEPILKLDLGREPPPPPVPSRRRRVLLRAILVGLALGALFTGVTAGMLMALPRPHTQGDYVIAGGVATLVSILALFVVLLSGQSKMSDTFYRRRPK